MLIDEKSIYVVDGGDYSIYCLGYTQARTVTNDIMKALGVAYPLCYVRT